MSFKKISLVKEYRPGTKNTPEKFFKSVLPEATLYRRASGYFTSSVFNLFREEILKFASDRGNIELVCSPTLTYEDINAINKGYDAAYDIVSNRLDYEIDGLLKNTVNKGAVEFLGTLIKLNILSIKVGFYTKGKGIFHDKTGYFVDKNHDVISFRGSANETMLGWSDKGLSLIHI